MTAVVLDAEAFNVLAGKPSARRRLVRQVLAAAHQVGHDVVVPAVVLAELYRPGHLTLVDACLARDVGIGCRDTDRTLARLVGGVLAAVRAGSEDMVDAHVVACAVEAGRGAIVTGDPSDIERLAAPYANVTLISLT